MRTSVRGMCLLLFMLLSGFTATAGQVRGITATAAQTKIAATPVPVSEPAKWPIRMVVFGDTQVYAAGAISTTKWNTMTRWVADNRDAMNIQHVLHVGDFTEHREYAEYELMSDGASQLDNKLPYLVAGGNHDNFEYYTTLYPVRRNLKNLEGFGAFYDPTSRSKMESMYLTKRINGIDFLFITVGYGAVNSSTLSWMNAVATNHPDHKIILLYHDLLTDNGDGSGNWTSTGSSLWSGFMTMHANISLAFCGHVYDTSGDDIAAGTRTDTGNNGNRVSTTLFNEQWTSRGWIRIIEIYEDGRVAHMTYSPVEKSWLTGPGLEFTFNPNTVSTHTVSGNVSGTTGVAMTIKPGGMTVTTDGSGNYSFADMKDGIYTITPKKGGFTFSPTLVRVRVSSGSATAPICSATPTLSYTITANTGVGGKIMHDIYSDPLTIVSEVVNSGTDSAVFYADADRSYHFTQWSDGSTDNPRVFAAVSQDLTVTAEFARDTYTVYFETDGTPGATLTGQTVQTVSHGDASTAVTVSVPAGYTFSHWTGTHPAYGPTNFVSSQIRFDNLRHVATFIYTGPATTHTLNVTRPWPFMGRVKIGENGSLFGSANVAIPSGGDSGAYYPVPYAGHEFYEWSDGNTDDPRTFRNITQFTGVEALFRKKSFAVNFQTDGTPGASITGNTSQIVEYIDSSFAVTAVAPSSHVFVNWTSPGMPATTINPLTVVDVISALTITANYAPR